MSQPNRAAGLHFQISLKEWHALYKARKALTDSSPESGSDEDRPARVRISRRRREQLRQRGQRLGV